MGLAIIQARDSAYKDWQHSKDRETVIFINWFDIGLKEKDKYRININKGQISGFAMSGRYNMEIK